MKKKKNVVEMWRNRDNNHMQLDQGTAGVELQDWQDYEGAGARAGGQR